MKRIFLTVVLGLIFLSGDLFAGTASQCRGNLEAGGWTVFMSGNKNEGDMAAVIACIVATEGAGTLGCLGDFAWDVANELGTDIVVHAIKKRGHFVINGGTMFDADVCVKTFPIALGTVGRDRYFYIRYKNNVATSPFTRINGQNAVYFQFQPQLYCHVSSEEQRDSYGFPVTVVSSSKNSGMFTGECGWAAGFYRRSNQPEVFMIESGNNPYKIGNTLCHVTDEAQLARLGGAGAVRVVSPDADLARGVPHLGGCGG